MSTEVKNTLIQVGTFAVALLLTVAIGREGPDSSGRHWPAPTGCGRLGALGRGQTNQQRLRGCCYFHLAPVSRAASFYYYPQEPSS